MNRSYHAATQLHEDGHHRRGNDAGVMATLRTTVLTYCVWLSSAQFALEFKAVMHDITMLLAMAQRRPNLRL